MKTGIETCRKRSRLIDMGNENGMQSMEAKSRILIEHLCANGVPSRLFGSIGCWFRTSSETRQRMERDQCSDIDILVKPPKFFAPLGFRKTSRLLEGLGFARTSYYPYRGGAKAEFEISGTHVDVYFGQLKFDHDKIDAGISIPLLPVNWGQNGSLALPVTYLMLTKLLIDEHVRNPTDTIDLCYLISGHEIADETKSDDLINAKQLQKHFRKVPITREIARQNILLARNLLSDSFRKEEGLSLIHI